MSEANKVRFRDLMMANPVVCVAGSKLSVFAYDTVSPAGGYHRDIRWEHNNFKVMLEISELFFRDEDVFYYVLENPRAAHGVIGTLLTPLSKETQKVVSESASGCARKFAHQKPLRLLIGKLEVEG